MTTLVLTVILTLLSVVILFSLKNSPITIFRVKAVRVGGPVAVMVLGLFFSLIKIIPAGHVGVKDIFGRVSPDHLGPGINLVEPWANIYVYSVKVQSKKQPNMVVPTKEGLEVQMDLSAEYTLIPEKLPSLYKKVGDSLEIIHEKIIDPRLRSTTREVTAKYAAKSLYSGDRERVAAEIEKKLVEELKTRGVSVQRILLRKVLLPKNLLQAIEMKTEAEQRSEQMKFLIDKERQEAERKRIEAMGIKNFQRIVSEGLTPKFLEWKGIEATEKLATSQNAKIVIIGKSKNGLPVILDTK